MQRLSWIPFLFVLASCKKELNFTERYDAYQKAFETAVAKEAPLYTRFDALRAKLTDAVPACKGVSKTDGYLRISSFMLKAFTGGPSVWERGVTDPSPNSERDLWDSPSVLTLPGLHPVPSRNGGSPYPSDDVIAAVSPKVAEAAKTVSTAPGFLVQTVDRYVAPTAHYPGASPDGAKTAMSYSSGEISGKIFVIDSANQVDSPRCSYKYEARNQNSLRMDGRMELFLDSDLAHEMRKNIDAQMAGQ